MPVCRSFFDLYLPFKQNRLLIKRSLLGFLVVLVHLLSNGLSACIPPLLDSCVKSCLIDLAADVCLLSVSDDSVKIGALSHVEVRCEGSAVVRYAVLNVFCIELLLKIGNRCAANLSRNRSGIGFRCEVRDNLVETVLVLSGSNGLMSCAVVIRCRPKPYITVAVDIVGLAFPTILDEVEANTVVDPVENIENRTELLFCLDVLCGDSDEVVHTCCRIAELSETGINCTLKCVNKTAFLV